MKNPLSSIPLFALVIAAGIYIGFRIVHVPDQRLFVALLGLVVFYPIIRFPLVGVYLLFLIMPMGPRFGDRGNLFYAVFFILRTGGRVLIR